MEIVPYNILLAISAAGTLQMIKAYDFIFSILYKCVQTCVKLIYYAIFTSKTEARLHLNCLFLKPGQIKVNDRYIPPLDKKML